MTARRPITIALQSLGDNSIADFNFRELESFLNSAGITRSRRLAEDDSIITHDLNGSDPGPVGNTPSVTITAQAGEFVRIFAQVDMRSTAGGFPGGEAYVFLTVTGGGTERIMRWVNGSFASFDYVTFWSAPSSTVGIWINAGQGFGGPVIVPVAADGEVTASLSYMAGGTGAFPNAPIAYFTNRKLWIERF